ncbi:MAG: hypothetical protein MZU84_02160 [Sphingobacterium sp.]|nr:hypothetical protein [Sphingobacterium sp.]
MRGASSEEGQGPFHRVFLGHQGVEVFADLVSGDEEFSQIPFDPHEKHLVLGIDVPVQIKDIAAVLEDELGVTVTTMPLVSGQCISSVAERAGTFPFVWFICVLLSPCQALSVSIHTKNWFREAEEAGSGFSGTGVKSRPGTF